MFDFNSITEQNEKETVIKFKEHGCGVAMGKYAAKQDDFEMQAKWSELMDMDKWSDNAIRNKMLEIANKINTTCNDTLLGDLSVAYTVKTTLGKRIKFTYTELYTFLRAILKERRASKEYLAAKAEAIRLKALVLQNKSVDELVKEANDKLAVLTAKFGEGAFEEEEVNKA